MKMQSQANRFKHSLYVCVEPSVVILKVVVGIELTVHKVVNLFSTCLLSVKTSASEPSLSSKELIREVRKCRKK